MDIHEYQNKRFFKEHNLSVLNGMVVYTPKEAGRAVQKIGGKKWRVKVQIHDRNWSEGFFTDASEDKKSGVQEASTPEEIIQIAENMLGHPFLTSSMKEAQIIQRVYIEEVCQVKEKFGISIRLDFVKHTYVIVVQTKDCIQELEVPLKPTVLFWCKVIRLFDVSNALQAKLLLLLKQMFQVFVDYNAVGIEFLPLVLTQDNQWVIEDGRIIFDNESIERFSNVLALKESPEGKEKEALAEKYNFRYTPFTGNIACLVNGSGLGGATIELLEAHQGRPACLLDVGTEPTGDSVSRALKMALSVPNVEGVFINIFGGLTRCDTIAQGLIEASREISADIPIVVRMDGTNAHIGERLLFESHLPFVVIKQPEEAVVSIVKSVGSLL